MLQFEVSEPWKPDDDLVRLSRQRRKEDKQEEEVVQTTGRGWPDGVSGGAGPDMAGGVSEPWKPRCDLVWLSRHRQRDSLLRRQRRRRRLVSRQLAQVGWPDGVSGGSQPQETQGDPTPRWLPSLIQTGPQPRRVVVAGTSDPLLKFPPSLRVKTQRSFLSPGRRRATPPRTTY